VPYAASARDDDAASFDRAFDVRKAARAGAAGGKPSIRLTRGLLRRLLRALGGGADVNEIPIAVIGINAIVDEKCAADVSGLRGIVSEDQMSIFSAILIASSDSRSSDRRLMRSQWRPRMLCLPRLIDRDRKRREPLAACSARSHRDNPTIDNLVVASPQYQAFLAAVLIGALPSFAS
jgi:hypothetical protein